MTARSFLPIALAFGSALLSGCGPSMTDLDHMAASGRIDQGSPVTVHLEADIAASREKVWALLVNAPAWPGWEPDISGISVGQPLASGTRFNWKAGSNTIHSQVRFFEPERQIIWTGKVLTAKAIHGWRLVSAPAGHTRVLVDESMDGPLIALLLPRQKLADADQAWLLALKKAAEQP